jgi:hypothetical protein
MAEAIE